MRSQHCPAAHPCLAGGAIAHVPAGINFFSPFSSLDLRLQKMIPIGDRVSVNLIGEGFNLLNQTNVRGSTKANYAGRNISIAPLQPSAPVQTNFFTPVSVAGGFFGSGGPRAFQLAARIEF
jgi:hypothetical protein